MPEHIDQTGNKVFLHYFPRRIISLVPSQTELLYDLGLEDEVVGITKFCVHPEKWFRAKTRIGGTKQLNIEIIRELKPDLIIANKEENVKAQVEELMKIFPVWVSDVNSLTDAYGMINFIGVITNKMNESIALNDTIHQNFSLLQPYPVSVRTAYLIWQKPYMSVGGDTFIHSILSIAGFNNIFSERIRYPEIKIEDLQKSNCELLLLSSEPFPFSQKHLDELQKALPSTQILLVDGEMFSWYGSRLQNVPGYLKKLYEQIEISR